jgi:hypothetical protein
MTRHGRDPYHFFAVDTEDDSHGNVHIVNFYEGLRDKHETEVFTQEDPNERARKVLEFTLSYFQYAADRGVNYGWACQLEYDLINMFGSFWLTKLCTLYYVGQGLMRASCPRFGVTLHDTLRHWPMSVEAMGSYLGLPKMERDFQSVTYCRRDTEIAWKFTAQMLDRYRALDLKPGPTLPSMAMQLFEKKFYPKSFVALPQAMTDQFREGYYGGRVEVYRFNHIKGPINHYDVNSLFPSVMRDGVFPDLDSYSFASRSLDLDRKEGMARVTLTVPPAYYPPLPMRGDTDVVFAYGRVTGTWCFPEIRQAIEDGADIDTVHWGWEFPRMSTPFQAYIDYCYTQRLAAHPGSLDDVLWKLYMNSLYGKFGQRGEMLMIHNDREILVANKEPKASANVIWAAYVTALARLTLLRFLRSTSVCYYTDTDSLFTPDILSTSKELGALKLEGEYTGMDVKGNKVYAVEKATPGKGFTETEPGVFTRYKAKGVKTEAAADFIRTGRGVFRRPVRLRESRRQMIQPNVWLEQEKVRHAMYTKRKVHPDGTTEPWEWLHYKHHTGHEE